MVGNDYRPELIVPRLSAEDCKLRTQMAETLRPKDSLVLLCPKCDRVMALIGIEPDGAKRERFTFQCEECAHLEVRSVRVK